MSDKDFRDQPNTLRIPLAEEHLEAEVTEREIGAIRFNKRVETTPVEETFDVRSDDISVERRARDEVVEAAREPWYEGDTLIIPVYEERIVVEKRLVLIEEILVVSRTKTEQVTAQDTVRREVIDVQTTGDV